MENDKCECCKKTTYRTEEEKSKLNKRLNIIEGQIRGIKQMIQDDRYCDDILTQMSAINKALESVENTILENHIRNCVTREIKARKYGNNKRDNGSNKKIEIGGIYERSSFKNRRNAL